MELTRERIEMLTKASVDPEVRLLARQLLAEMDKPKVWTNAPNNAIIAKVHFYIADKVYARSNGIPEVYTRTLPKSRIDEIAEEAKDLYMATSAGDRAGLTHIIKSAILRALEEKKANR